MTFRPYWTCRRASPPYLIAVTLAHDPFAAREALCPGACVAPTAIVSPDLLERLADLQPGEVREIEVPDLPSWRDAHRSVDLASAAYCEDIGYDLSRNTEFQPFSKKPG